MHKLLGLQATIFADDDCCICFAKLDDKYGNNPAPVMSVGHCCPRCNVAVVLPARFASLFNRLPENCDNGKDPEARGPNYEKNRKKREKARAKKNALKYKL